MLLGCIADDFTGATDLAGILVRNGMRTVQTIGVPDGADIDADAVVVALKSRTIPADEAVHQSLAALRYLRACGANQFLFKYCSTFDSTAAGNIGPVAEALMKELGVAFTYFCPALPENGRTIFKGHLFVGDTPLHESGMRDHPLTPMNDSNLVRVLAAQSTQSVGLIAHHAVHAGPQSLVQAMDACAQAGHSLAIIDAVVDEDVITIAKASRDMTLVTGGSGIAIGLPQNFRDAGLLGDEPANQLPAIGGLAAVIAGSCSLATQEQVRIMSASCPSFCVDPIAVANGQDVAANALEWAATRIESGPVLVYATASAQDVAAAQSALGVAEAGALVEQTLARVAKGLVEQGVRRLVVAGGETSGAVVNALGVRRLRIGPEIDPGVPWTSSEGGCPDCAGVEVG